MRKFASSIALFLLILAGRFATAQTASEVYSGEAPRAALRATFSSQSEFFHQDAAGQTHVLVEPIYRAGSSSSHYLNSSGTTINTQRDTSRREVDLTASRGWNSWLKSSLNVNFAQSHVGLENSNGIQSRSASYDSTGIGNFHLATQGIHLFERASLIYGISVGLSPVAHKSSNVGVEGNQFSGGQNAMPYFGFEAALARARLGAELSSTIYGPRQFVTPNAQGAQVNSGTNTGGNLLAVTGFAEMHFRSVLAGLSLALGQVDSSETEDRNGRTQYASYNDLRARAYGVLNFDGLEVLPVIGYSRVLTDRRDGVSDDGNADFLFSISGRLTL